jgi:hypothetical protein
MEFQDAPGTSQGCETEIPQQAKARNKNSHSQEKINEVARLAAEGLSSRQIALKLEVTRNVIIGICARHSIQLRYKKSGGRRAALAVKRKVRPKPQPKVKRAVVKSKPALAGPKALFTGRRGEKLVCYEAHQGVTLAQLSNNNCRWPLGELLDPPMNFCGKPAEDVYCPTHLHVRKYGSASL